MAAPPAARRLAWPGDVDVDGVSVKGLTGRWRIVAMDWLDCRWSKRDGRPFVEFTWEGDDEGDQVNGRGWAAVTEDGGLTGHLFFHLGDDSGFRATPFEAGTEVER